MHMGVCQRNFLATQKYQFRLSLLPKNITYFYALTTVNEHKNPVTMPIEARIASTRTQRYQFDYALCHKKHHGYDFSYFGFKNITFGIIQTKKYQTYLLSCSECPTPPPGEQSLIKRTCVSDGGGKYGFALELRPVENCLGYGHSSTKFVKFR